MVMAAADFRSITHCLRKRTRIASWARQWSVNPLETSLLSRFVSPARIQACLICLPHGQGHGGLTDERRG